MVGVWRSQAGDEGGFQLSIQGAAVDPQQPTQSETAGKAEDVSHDRFLLRNALCAVIQCENYTPEMGFGCLYGKTDSIHAWIPIFTMASLKYQ